MLKFSATPFDTTSGHELAVSPDSYLSFRPAPELAADEVHVWTLSQHSQSVTDFLSLLSPDEVERASRFHGAALYERFLADHGALRLLLSAYLETDPRKLTFVTNEYGKPRLGYPTCRLRFNMSHSGAITVIALCLDTEIGIDVEEIRSIPEWRDIASTHFSSLENHFLNMEPETSRMDSFFRCWTRKEALIKAIGQGLSLPLDTFSVTVSASDAAILLACDWDDTVPSDWSLLHFEPIKGYMGAVALRASGWSTRFFAWPERGQAA